MLLRDMLVAASIAVVSTQVPAQTEPLLQLQGQPYSGGDMTLHLTADAGVLAYVLYGLDPLDPPLQLPKGPFYIGTLANGVLIGQVPAAGRIDVAFTVPPLAPALAGIPLVMQGFVPGALSNPATLPLDQPYLLPQDAVAIDHPVPSFKANFGDTVAAGDFNDDGVVDLAVGAWFESVNGIDRAGRVYVMWGPDFTTHQALESSAPQPLKFFGTGLAIADLDGNGVDDLVVGEGSGGDPPAPGTHGHAYVYSGSASFSAVPSTVITSAGTGIEVSLFGRQTRLGDIDGDDVPDLVCGTPNATVQGLSKAGRLEVFHGPVYGVAQLIENPEPKTNDFFGSAVALGDVTGDGVPDIIEASGRASTGGLSQVGRLHVYDGPTLALLQTIENPAPAAGDRFGEGLHAADLDGDGLVEVITSDVKDSFYVVWDALAGASISFWPKPPTPNPSAPDSSFGYFFTATDANGDELVDIVIADPFEGDSLGCGFGAGGALYVVLAPYFSTYLRSPSPSSACLNSFSWNLIGADIDGDGVQELLAGDPTADSGGVFNAGRVVILKR